MPGSCRGSPTGTSHNDASADPALDDSRWASKPSPTGIFGNRAGLLPLPRTDWEREMDIRETAVIRPHTVAGVPLAGQKALVTGGNSGIGKAVSIPHAQSRAPVLVHHVNGPADAPVRTH